MAKNQNAAVGEEAQGVSFGEEGGQAGDALVINLNDVEDTSFTPLPKGIYDCVIESLEFKHSQRSGNPMWSWVLEVTSGEYAGRKLFFHTVWAGDGLGITKKNVERVFPELKGVTFSPEKFANEGNGVGRACRARVDIKMYEGEKRNNVKELFAASEGGDGFLS